MGRRVEGGQVEQAGLAMAAGLFALVSPWAAALVLAGVGVWFAAHARLTPARATSDLGALLALAGVAVFGALLGWQGAVGAALVWRGWSEILRAPETYGIAEPPWLAIVYRWSPVAAALLFRLDAPFVLTATIGAVAGLTLSDWALRRLAEWRLGEPQPFDTRGYMIAQGRVLAIILLLPEPTAALAALTALAIARHVERTPSRRYTAAL
jgi:hypothetical protein